MKWFFILKDRFFQKWPLSFRELVLLLAFLPLSIVAIFLFILSKETHLIDLEIKKLESKRILLLNQRKKRENFIQNHKGKDPEELKRALFNFIFFQKDMKVLEDIEESYGGLSPAMQKRYKFLNSSENRLEFQEKIHRTGAFYGESIWTQTREVEAKDSDIFRLLLLLEKGKGGSNRPHIVITQFHMQKVEDPRECKCYRIRLDYLERDCKDEA